MAITFLKQAINTYESVRNDNQALSQEFKEYYITTIEKDYRNLSGLLLQENRILEAQQVLDLLKIQELDDYLRGVRGTDSNLSILRAEQAILEKYDELTTTAIELSQELSAIREVAEDLRSPTQKQRILTLIDLQADINKQFRDFSTSPEVRDLLAQLTPELQDATVRLSSLNKIETELTDLNAALIYPLILEDRLEIVVMLPGGPPLRRTVNGLTSTELNTTILALRQAIDSPSHNPLPAAQQIYDWLIRPIETDLAQSGVTSLIYAPDGQLRYIPLSALHNGENWLIETYRINNITAESLTEFDDLPTANPRVLAAAFADTTITHPIEIDGQPRNFSGLPFAGAELDNLTASQPNITTFRDRDFTLNAIKGVMNEHNILHFATHAAFVNSNPEDSFILFGNGDDPTLIAIKDWRLRNVAIVVLRDSETGLDGFGNGAEILGMGYQFQRSGAGAVMASLWSVDDRGTQDLMARFYHHLSEGKPKAQALQQAQLDLITSDGLIPNADPRGSIVLNTPAATLPENLEGLRHPYYWAPFILIGNGL
ncbi:MAG: CHAT domain-containing protein [Phormidesmis sp.]